MEYYESLNKVVRKIEDNLDNEISYEDLAKIIGTSSYTLQRIFAFLTGITLTEYIRKRRLSRTVEDLKLTDDRIIDIAIKYGYDSQISFSNAFKKMHGVTPSTVRKENISLKLFQPINFKPVTNIIEDLEFRVIKLKEQKLYGVSTGVIDNENKEAIKDLYNKIEANGTMKYLIENSDGIELYYGISEEIYEGEISDKFKYYVAGKEPRKDLIEINLPKATWACFKVDSKLQKDILKLYNTIYTKWLPNSNYKQILLYPELEIYYEDYCEICIAVK